MAGTSILHRRKVRELEAKRDKLIEAKSKALKDLNSVRSELKHVRKNPVK